MGDHTQVEWSVTFLNDNNNNHNEVLIKREPLVLPELGALYREKGKKEARTVEQQ